MHSTESSLADAAPNSSLTCPRLARQRYDRAVSKPRTSKFWTAMASRLLSASSRVTGQYQVALRDRATDSTMRALRAFRREYLAIEVTHGTRAS